MSRTCKTRLLLHIPINLLEICAKLSNEVKEHLNLVGGIGSADDSVLDKPYSDPQKTDLVSYFWSGKHKRTGLAASI